MDQGDDEVEFLSVEIWVDNFPITVVTAYGPQNGDALEKKDKFWYALERQAMRAFQNGSGFILQMDSNAHLGPKIVTNDPNDQNANGKLFNEFLERLPHLKLLNSSSVCQGSITRTRKTINNKSQEKSILDVFLCCD